MGAEVEAPRRMSSLARHGAWGCVVAWLSPGASHPWIGGSDEQHHESIPAEVIAAVQEALFVLMSEAAEGLSQALSSPDRERNPDWFVDDRRRLEHACVLLDSLGWDVDVIASEPVRSTSIVMARDLVRRSSPICRCLREAGAEASDRWRAERGKPARKEQIVREVELLRELAVTLEQGAGGASGE